jgi:hypothetical protein
MIWRILAFMLLTQVAAWGQQISGGNASGSSSITSGTTTTSGCTDTAVLESRSNVVTCDGAILAPSGGPVSIGNGGNSTAQLTLTPNSGTASSFGSANSGGQLIYFLGAAQHVGFGSGVTIVSSDGLKWTNSTSSVTTTLDTSIYRQAAGVLEIGTGGTNASGSLLLTGLTSTGSIKMTNLPTTTPGGTTSTMCWDSTAGALWTDTSATACGIVSALRFKHLIPGDPAINIAGLANLNVGPWQLNKGDKKIHIGLIADEVEAMDARCAVYDSAGMIYNYEDRCIIAYLVAARKSDRESNQADILALRAEFNEYKKAHP